MRISKLAAFFVAIAVMACVLSNAVYAYPVDPTKEYQDIFLKEYPEIDEDRSNVYQNPDTKYTSCLIHKGESLSLAEYDIIQEKLKYLTEYYHVVFCVTDDNPFYDESMTSEASFAKKYSDALYAWAVPDGYSQNDTLVLVLDYETKYLYLDAYGKLRDKIYEPADWLSEISNQVLPVINEEGTYDGFVYAIDLLIEFYESHEPVVPDRGDVEPTIMMYGNLDTKYSGYIVDGAHLFSEKEMSTILNSLEKATKYTNVIVCTTDYNPYGNSGYSSIYEQSFCENIYDRYIYEFENSDNAVIFLIDMDTRWLYIFREGRIETTLTTGICDSITDNVYKYASAKEYDTCTIKAVDMIYRVLDGQRIAQPMKIISNVLIALVLSFLITYLIAKSKARAKAASDAALLQYAVKMYENGVVHEEHINTTKTYNPRSSSSSSGGGGHRSGGGGHHGGGGGHRF